MSRVLEPIELHLRQLPIIADTLPASDFRFSFSCFHDHRALHSFPTRRSSDLTFHSSTLPPCLCHLSRAVLRTLGKSTYPSPGDRKSTRLNSSHVEISYAVFCLKKKNGVEHDGNWCRCRDLNPGLRGYEPRARTN